MLPDIQPGNTKILYFFNCLLDGMHTKNLIGANLIALRKKYHLSQRGLAHELQLAGYDMDKNVITRIETQQRYVTDIEIKALCDLFNVSFEDLIK